MQTIKKNNFMKKLILIFTAALLLGVNVADAQRIDMAALNARLAKADAATEHPKKGLKGTTWITRGNEYFKTITEPTKVLYDGVDVPIVEAACGKGKVAQQKIGNKQYKKLTYPYFVAYVQNNKVVAWTVSRMIRKDALQIALDSYAKALEIDPSLNIKVKDELEVMVNYYKALGSAAITLNNMKVGSDAFLNACKVQEQPAYGTNGQADATMLFYSGYMLTMQAEKATYLYGKAEATLNKALKAGYQKVEDAITTTPDADRGNLYYYLYHCAYSQKEKAPAKLKVAKKYLQEGIAKYPKNQRIFEGLLQIYTNEEGMGDPMELLGTIEEMIKINPKSINAWFAKGRIHYAMKDYDACIEAFTHVVALEPKAYDSNFYMGLFHMLKGDDQLDKMKAITYKNQAAYDADLKKLNGLYAEAVPFFEVAHQAKPKDEGTLEYLKTLCFRLRDEPGMMEKYNKYNELFKAL